MNYIKLFFLGTFPDRKPPGVGRGRGRGRDDGPGRQTKGIGRGLDDGVAKGTGGGRGRGGPGGKAGGTRGKKCHDGMLFSLAILGSLTISSLSFSSMMKSVRTVIVNLLFSGRYNRE